MPKRSETKRELESMRDDLTQLGDEIRLKVHLGKMDLRDRFRELEPEIVAFERRAERMTEEVGEELRESWQHLRTALRRIKHELEEAA
jgi:hypothetical protein